MGTKEETALQKSLQEKIKNQDLYITYKQATNEPETTEEGFALSTQTQRL